MARREFERTLVKDLRQALLRQGNFLHALIGARQTGKSTVSRQIAGGWAHPVIQASADEPLPPGPEWIEVHWARARMAAKDRRVPVLLVLDEAQKVRGWSEVTKRLWDEDRSAGRRLRVLLVGSSALLVQHGLAESLAGRFLLHRSSHWSFPECEEAFRWKLDQWLYFGGYPGAAPLASDESLWRRYVADSLVEPALARDVLGVQQITKPALLRHLFALAVRHPAEILSFNKMLGTLQDAGNTVTLAHYLRLLDAAFLVSGLSRFSDAPRARGSSPKLLVWNNALITALSGRSFEQTRGSPELWGRLVENAVGAHVASSLSPPRFRLSYWRDRDQEVDYVVEEGDQILAIEVKSGRSSPNRGIKELQRRAPRARALIVGSGGMPLEDFFRSNPERLFRK